MSKKTPMTREDARRIQSEADRTGKNQDFKARAMRAAYRNEPLEGSSDQKNSSNDGND